MYWRERRRRCKKKKRTKKEYKTVSKKRTQGKKRKDKRISKHACNRFKQRYGFKLDKETKRFLVRTILYGEYEIVERQNACIEVRRIYFYKQWVYFVYSLPSRSVITFLE